MTQLEKARKGIITREMKTVAKKESLSADSLRKKISKGRAVIPANPLHKKLSPIGIGEGLRVKVNANIGSSPCESNLKTELRKLKVALNAGTDTVMDLSIGGNIDSIRKKVISNCSVPIGTVPVYQPFIEKKFFNVQEKDFLQSIERHAKDGVDFVTIHSGVRKKIIPLLKKRKTGVVSRGGSLLIKWMNHFQQENPLYEAFDEVLEIAKKYDLTLSLGDGLRPGSIFDSTDKAQISELKELGKLTQRAWKKDVQVMIEGPGHIPLHEIKRNIELEKKYCNNAPFYVLGPLVTDIAPGYDHITAAIGGALAAFHGADFLCYVTPAEHLSLPSIEDVKEGVIAGRIAAHAADIAKGLKGAKEWDEKMSFHRKKLNWNKMFSLAIDKEKAIAYRKKSKVSNDFCSMCGEYCALKGI
ncbi:MAG: phosphomethylpyrimidine synthase ThiC [archaeon]|nr:phosphomethylpyrimidine synthase ThiC [Candidatus Micrarchaeota archaeon]